MSIQRFIIAGGTGLLGKYLINTCTKSYEIVATYKMENDLGIRPLILYV